jgi:hypothetical protein
VAHATVVRPSCTAWDSLSVPRSYPSWGGFGSTIGGDAYQHWSTLPLGRARR